MDDLTVRQKEILTYTVTSYIETSLPVGSHALTQRYPLGLSPASVRNELGLLEEKGYLAQPHTSAGRMPTDRGYQFYVKEFVQEEPVNKEFLELIVQEMEQTIENLEDLMERVSSVLSAVAKEAVIVLSPTSAKRPRLCVEGSRYILNQPEFQDLKKFQQLIETLEDKPSLIELLKQRISRSGVQVAIGQQELLEGIWDCSLVSAPYTCQGQQIGILGVLGPRRMAYGRMMGLVHQVAEQMGVALNRWGPGD